MFNGIVSYMNKFLMMSPRDVPVMGFGHGEPASGLAQEAVAMSECGSFPLDSSWFRPSSALTTAQLIPPLLS
jgi:hypothetical protein